MPRIAHFIDTEVIGGAEVMMLDLCSSLKELGGRDGGFEPVVVHFRHPHLPRMCEERGLECVVAPGYQSFKSIRTLPKFAWEFAKFLRAQKIDLLHSHLFGPITAGSLAARIARIPNLGTLHDIYIVEEKPLRVRLLQAAAISGTHLVTISEHMRSFYTGRAHFPAAKLHAIPNGVEQRTPRTLSMDQLREIKLSLGIGADELVVICVARLTHLKRHDVLLESIARLPSDIRVRLLLVGEGPDEAEIRAFAAQKGLLHRTVFAGLRSDVEELLYACDIFLLCSDSEGLSRSILEAMLAGLPVVVTDVGGNSELVVEKRTGFLVPRNDPKATAARVEQLLRDPVLRQRFGAAARQRALSQFRHRAMVAAYAELYSELLH